MSAVKSKGEQLRRREIMLIKMGQAQLGLDDGTYRAMLALVCGGKTSASDLTWQERQSVINHMKARGFVVKSTRAWDDGLTKLRAMWYALAEVGAVTRPNTSAEVDQAIEVWAKRMLPRLDALRFASGQQINTLIEAMKKWCARVGAPDELDQVSTDRP